MSKEQGVQSCGDAESVGVDTPSFFADSIDAVVAKIQSPHPFLSFEYSPRVSAKLDRNLIEQLQHISHIDAFVCTDSPLARFKPSSILSSIKLQQALKKPVICTLSMRDRNSIALCGDILAANEFGLRLFLTLTGDSIKYGDCLESKGVFEDNSLKLGAIIDNLNEGRAINGKTLREKAERIYNFQVINAYANNSQSLINKMQKKLEASHISAFFTQPVYSLEAAEFLLTNLEKLNIQNNTHCTLVLGFFPVLSYKGALFLRDKLPGVYIPNQWIQSLENAHKKGIEEEKKVGLEQSLQLFKQIQKLHNKFHFMSANNPTLLGHFL